MRDEMDARIWIEHHNQFSLSVDRALARLGAGFSRLRSGAAAGGTTAQALALAAAFAITALSFNTTA
ncbi:MAG TPA: hypothetical protein VEX35_11690 [Allosphingosinicella sp.]|nr:hypothetical protein [Allosphingosinicella sp.]